MKKYTIVVVLFAGLLAASAARSQPVSVGVRGGMSIPNLTTPGSNPVSSGYSSKLGGDIAVFGNIRFSKLFSLQPMLEYSQQGGKRNGRQAFPIPDQFEPIPPALEGKEFMYVDINSKAQLNYLMLPILAKFGWTLGGSSSHHDVRVYVDTGPFVGYLLSARQKFSNTKTKIYESKDAEQPVSIGGNPLPAIDIADSTPTDRNTRPDLKNWNVGISSNIGVAYHFDRSSVFIEGGGNYGFIKIQKDAEKGQNRTGAATATVGLSYRL